jgi:hypothetical protein
MSNRAAHISTSGSSQSRNASVVPTLAASPENDNRLMIQEFEEFAEDGGSPGRQSAQGGDRDGTENSMAVEEFIEKLESDIHDGHELTVVLKEWIESAAKHRLVWNVVRKALGVRGLFSHVDKDKKGFHGNICYISISLMALRLQVYVVF